VALTLPIGGHAPAISVLLLPFAADSFLYLAASDLIPELRRMRAPSEFARQMLLILAGLGALPFPLLLQ
jgi:zinc transporter ZupT